MLAFLRGPSVGPACDHACDYSGGDWRDWGGGIISTRGEEQRPVSDTERGAAARSDPTGVAALRSILKIRPFRRLWIVLGIASLGDWLGLLATSLFASQQVSNTAGQGLAFGGVIAVRLLPALVLGPLAGVFADRFDRRKTMVVTDLIRFPLLLSIPAAALVTSGAAVVYWTLVMTVLVEAVTMAWLPAKDAAVPNLLPKGRLETANQLTLATTYGVTPVAAALLLAAMTSALSPVAHATGLQILDPIPFSLYFLAFTRLATAFVVGFGIREIGGRSADRQQGPNLFREFIDGWRYVGKTSLVRGLVLGILAAFAAGGMVVGSAKFYASSLGGGETTFSILFAMIFIGLALGITLGPLAVRALSRRRWFGMSIVLAGGSVVLMSVAWDIYLAIFFVILVGIGAGMAFLSGTTLLGGEVGDDVRGRVFGFVNMMTRVVLMLAISVSSVLVGVGGDTTIPLGPLGRITIDSTRYVLFGAGVLAVLAGVGAFRQMDDKRGVPVLADLWASLRGRPLSIPEPVSRRGLFIVFEGGEGAGKSTQVSLLADRLRERGLPVTCTREPGATQVGEQIRGLLLDPQATGGPTGVVMTPRAEALLYAADRAHHVASVVRPALAEGNIVISDRYIDSSLAYQGAGRVLPVEELAWVSAWATGGLRPDLVVLLDLDPAEGLARVQGRAGTNGADRLESEAQPFHERVRYGFLDLAAADPRRYLVLDATLPPERLAATVLARVETMIPSLAPADLVPADAGTPSDDEAVPAPPPVSR